MRSSVIPHLQTKDGLVIKPKAYGSSYRVPGADRLSSIDGKHYMRMSIKDAVKHTGSSELSKTYYRELMRDSAQNNRCPHSTYDVYVPV